MAQPGIGTTSKGRAIERHRRIALTALASVAAKVISISTMLITVPLTLNYLGAERYGLWMTVSSVIAMMVFADFGIGNGLMNAVTEAFGKDDEDAMRTHIVNAMVLLIMLSAAILFVFSILYPAVPWGRFFNVSTSLAIQEAGPCLAAFMVCFAIGVPAAIVQRVQMGLQQGFTSSLWQAAGSTLGLFATLLAIHLEAGLPWLVLAMAGSPVVSLLINGVVFFFIQRRDLLPEISSVSWVGMKRILQGGMIFFALQLAVSIGFASDNIILARTLGSESVAQYSVVARLFEGILMIIGIIFAPFWPAYGEAKARGDQRWIRKTLSGSMIATLVMTVGGSLLLVLFYKPIFAAWVGPEFALSLSLVALCSVWMILKGLGLTYSMFLNGINAIRVQVVIATIFTIVSIIAKIFFVSRFGLNGLLAAMICCYTLSVVMPYAFLNSRLLPHEADWQAGPERRFSIMRG